LTGTGAGVDTAWGQDAKRLEARKLLDAKRAAHFVGWRFGFTNYSIFLRDHKLNTNIVKENTINGRFPTAPGAVPAVSIDLYAGM